MLWLQAASLKLPVFPCQADKSPMPRTHGFKDAQTDPRKIRDLFKAFPDAALIGVPTGAASGFDVLDLDTARHQPPRTWLQAYGVPRTRCHQTESGGFHFLFKTDGRLRCSNGNGNRKGIDIKADGGYIIWWPCRNCPVNDLPMSPWPESTLNAFLAVTSPRQINYETPPPISDKRLAGIIRRVGTAINGERNSVLFWGALKLGEWIKVGDLKRSDAERLLLHAARQTNLDDVSATKTIASGINRTAN